MGGFEAERSKDAQVMNSAGNATTYIFFLGNAYVSHNGDPKETGTVVPTQGSSVSSPIFRFSHSALPYRAYMKS